MKVLLVGSGGREHAIAMAIKKSEPEPTLYAAMKYKNPGIAKLCEDYSLVNEMDIPKITDYADKFDLVVIGPEAPLAAGIVDSLESRGIRTFGPTTNAAMIESDKGWARSFMSKHGIKGCPRYELFTDLFEADTFIKDNIDERDLVIKPVGLTGGKGVLTINEYEEGRDYLKKLQGQVIIEECLTGEEFTIQAFVDGHSLSCAPAVQDHKRAYEGDLGPNTGGMGSYSDKSYTLPFMSNDDFDRAVNIMEDTVNALRSEGINYKGILYGQFMLTKLGPMVVEFNCRFGDPEAMNVLPLLRSDFIELAESSIDENLKTASYELCATVCKYVVPSGYPEKPQLSEIRIDEGSMDALLFYASVNEEGDKITTTTSRSLAVLGIADTIEDAEHKAENALSAIKGNIFSRHDIGTKKVIEKRIEHMKAVRSS